MNTFGELFRMTTFGESHGVALGTVVDGCPAGVTLSTEEIQAALDRRRPGQSALTTARAEGDRVEVLSGVYEQKTLGTPIAALVRNHDARSQDYAQLKPADRPGHADAVWQARFQHRDPRGGGRTSGRETLSRVIGGAVAEALLRREIPKLSTVAWVSQVGPLFAPLPGADLTRAMVDQHTSRCFHAETARAMESLILEAKSQGDSYGGAVTVRVTDLPVGLGEPVFAKLKATLSTALMGIGTVAGVVFGPPNLQALTMSPGSVFHERKDDNVSEVYGGIQGGLSNGAPLYAQVLLKPPATLGTHAKAGRHDPCILPRVVPVVEAMVSVVLADAWLMFLSRPHRP
jgi:chorismate synthase